ncbi:MAG: MFS transporter [Candidatus Latescibacterota bacterium]
MSQGERAGAVPGPGAAVAPQAMQKARLFVLTLSHFTVDTYASLLAPILPLLILRLDLSYASAGVLGTMVSLIGLSQPLMGMLADRMRRRILVVLGVVLSAVFSPLVGLAPSYAAAALALALGGIGVAAFHPQSFIMAGDLSGRSRAFGLALFTFGGTLALGLTPLWVTTYADRFGLEHLPFLALPGLLMAMALGRVVPLDNPRRQGQSYGLMWRALARRWAPLTLVTVLVILRSITALAFGTFLAVLGQERGIPAEDAGRLPLSVYNTAGVTGSLLAGYLADRLNPKPLVWGPLLASAPLLYFYVLMPHGWPGYVLLALGGAAVLSSNSVLVAIVQELAPDNAALASSLPQGLAWGLAGMTLPFVGHVADQITMVETLKYLALLPVLTAVLAFFLPSTCPPAAPASARG